MRVSATLDYRLKTSDIVLRNSVNFVAFVNRLDKFLLSRFLINHQINKQKMSKLAMILVRLDATTADIMKVLWVAKSRFF